MCRTLLVFHEAADTDPRLDMPLRETGAAREGGVEDRLGVPVIF